MTGQSSTGTAQQGNGSRIPLSLQAVFLASNRGKEVLKPPPEKAAHKTYFRSWIFQGFGRKKKQRKKNKNKDKKEPNEAKQLSNVIQIVGGGTRQQPESSPELISKDAKGLAAVSKRKPPPRPPFSPQAHLDVLIHARGYSTRRYRTLQTGYYSKPTEYQQASYHVNIVKHVRNHRVGEFKSIMSSGISPNPCNAYGESLVHMVARRGNHELLRVMLDCGTSVQVCDDYGRTPLHDACWAAAPSFQTVELIADKDMALFHMTDSRGAVPLSYVRREHWPLWIKFLEAKKDAWWPIKTEEDMPAPLIEMAPNERPLPEPDNALSMELAGMVASGVISPEEAMLLKEDDSDGDYSDSDDDSDDSSDYDSDEDSDDENADEYHLGFSADEMAGMLLRLEHSQKAQQQSQ